MKRLFLMLSIVGLFLAAGCEATPAGDPEFKKEKAAPEKMKADPTQQVLEVPDDA